LAGEGHKRGFVPAEVKWTEQIRPADLKQIGAYPNGMVLGKAGVCGRIDALPCWPLIWWLLHLRA
jgi:hypothetical protein